MDDNQLSKQQDLDLKYKLFILFSTALLHTNIEFHYCFGEENDFIWLPMALNREKIVENNEKNSKQYASSHAGLR